MNELGAICWILGAIGWIANIFQVAGMVSAPVTGLFIIKAVGLAQPALGAVMGYIGFFS